MTKKSLRPHDHISLWLSSSTVPKYSQIQWRRSEIVWIHVSWVCSDVFLPVICWRHAVVTQENTLRRVWGKYVVKPRDTLQPARLRQDEVDRLSLMECWYSCVLLETIYIWSLHGGLIFARCRWLVKAVKCCCCCCWPCESPLTALFLLFGLFFCSVSQRLTSSKINLMCIWFVPFVIFAELQTSCL